MSYKKAFTMVELVVTMLIVALLSWYAVVERRVDTRINDMNTAYNQISGFLANAVLDSTIGYPNGNGGDCSTTNDYINISAYRAKECSGLVNFIIEGAITTPAEQNNGTVNYLKGGLPNLVQSGGRIYIGNSVVAPAPAVNSDEFYLFFDFSRTTGDDANERAKNAYFIEEVFLSRISKDFSSLIVGVFPLATRPNDASTQAQGDGNADGTTMDGMFGVLFRN